MEIDIRNKLEQEITVIRFAEHPNDSKVACDVIVKGKNNDCPVWLENSGESTETMGVRNKKDAANLIKGLQKAIDLGWFE